MAAYQSIEKPIITNAGDVRLAISGIYFDRNRGEPRVNKAVAGGCDGGGYNKFQIFVVLNSQSVAASFLSSSSLSRIEKLPPPPPPLPSGV